MKKITLFSLLALTILLNTGCDTLNKIPTNTSGGIFSLNGNWKLDLSSDYSNQVGTVVMVAPGLSSAYVTTLAKNGYCYRVNDEAWKSIKPKLESGFTLSCLAGACNGSPVYKEGELMVISNDRIRITGRTKDDMTLLQEWVRVKK
jgi:hypothetical protein